MRRNSPDKPLDQDETNRLRESTKNREKERRQREEEERKRKDEVKEKAKEGLKAIVKKKSKKGIWEKYSYHIIFGVLGALLLFALFGGSSGETRRLSDILVNEEDLIIKVNSGKRPYTVEANSFFEGWTLQDVKAILKNGFTKKKSLPRCAVASSDLAADKYSFTEKHPNCVSKVANQGNCSSGFAFATTGAFSDRLCIANNDVIAFQASPQHPLACDKATSKGCQGGFVVGALDLGRVAGFVDTDCLNYDIEKADECESEKFAACKRAFISDYCVLEGISEIKRQLAATGPLVALVQVTKEFLVYKDGIYDESYSDYKIDGLQAVKIVGYDTAQNGEEYWIIENSWGTDWGQGGYAHVKMGVLDSMIDKFAVSIALKDDKEKQPEQQ